MSQSNKKQNFLQGAALLAAANAIVKLIGAFYKVPLMRIIGELGYGYFMTAYDIYSMLLMISTTGLPIAMSRMISREHSLEHYDSLRRVYKVAQPIFLILGLFSSLLMLIFCRELAAMQNQPGAVTAIVCLAPCAFLMGIMSTFRGFFQGQENMKPTSYSQVIEAVIKLFAGLGIAYLVAKLTNSEAFAAGGAILGVTLSCTISVFYLYSKFRPAWQELPSNTNEVVPTKKQTAKELLSIAVPLTIGSAALYVLAVIETGVYMDRIVGLIAAGRYDIPLVAALRDTLLAADPTLSAEMLHSQVATSMKGLYNFAQTVFNMPVSFIAPITISMLPAITAQLTLKKDREVRITEESSARITGLLSLPCSVGLCLLAGPVMSLLGGYGNEGLEGMKLELAEKLMFLLAVGIFPDAVVQYTNVVLQSHGRINTPVVHMLLVGAVRLLLVHLLAGNPAIGIMGVPVCGLLSYIAISAMNLIAIRVWVPQKPALLRNLLKPAIPALIMGAAVFGVQRGLIALLGAALSPVIMCGVSILVGVVVYAVCVVVCKVITYEDCLLLPKGEKLAKVLKL